MSSSLSIPRGRRVLVTGAGGGIGRALVTALLDSGAEVVALDLPKSLDGAGLSDQVAAFGCDLTSAHEVKTAFGKIAARFEALDGFVGLAGFARAKAPVVETAPETWNEVLDGNLGTTFLPLKWALPLLRKGTDPSIVTMASAWRRSPRPVTARTGSPRRA